MILPVQARPARLGPASVAVFLATVALILWPIGCLAQSRPAGPSFPTPRNPEKYVAGRILVRFWPGRSEAAKSAVHQAVGGRVRASYKTVPDLQLVDLPTGLAVPAALAEYRKNPNIEYAEPDYRVYPMDIIPNDPLFPLTWGMKNTGDQNGVAGADISATLAWQLTTGSNNVVIGLLDTGVDFTHPDLAANIYQNTPDCNSNSVGADGWVGDCHGIDVAGDAAPNDPFDYIGHGTHVSGIMGALGNNGTGVAGVNWQVSIIPCKFIDWDGGTTSGAIQCLEYMAWFKEHGVNVVATNNSWGGSFYSQALHDAIQAQMQDGILFIAAAGNGDIYDNSSDNDVNNVYPASYDLPNVIAVAATDRRDELAWFSNFGRRSVHLGAPGVSVVSTFPGGYYQELSGTSMATPHVTGSAALLAAYNPSLDWRGLKNLLLAGGDPNPNLSGTVTQKRLNVYGSMTCANQEILAREQPRNDVITAGVNSPVLLRALHINCSSPAGGVTVTVQPGGQTIELLDDGNSPDIAPNDGVYSGIWTPAQPGVFALNFPGGDVVTVYVLLPYKFSSAPSNYVSIQGQNLQLLDDQTVNLSLPFPVHFGGQTFDHFFVSDNGILTFDRAFNSSYPFPIPYSDSGAVVAPFWNDLQPFYPGDSNVFWDVAGAPPSRQLVVEWRNLPLWPFGSLTADLGPVGEVTFQTVFHEDVDEVDFNYANVDFGYYGSWASGGAAGSIGIQIGPSQGTQYSYFKASVSAGTSLQWLPASPDFSIQLQSATQTAFAGQNAGFTGTVQALFNLDSSVTFSCAGAAPPLCTGATVSPTSQGSPFAIQAGNAAPGTYNFNIQGQSSDSPPLVHTVPVELDVVDYSLTAPSPSTLTLPDGGAGAVQLSLSGAGPFNAPVTLSCSGLPSGASCGISPASPVALSAANPVSVQVSIALAPQTPAGTYNVTLVANAAGAPGAKTQTLQLVVQASPDFLLSSASSALRSFAGNSASTMVNVAAQDGFSTAVMLGCTAVPAGPSCMVSPSPVTSFPTPANLTVMANGAPPGSYQLTITATAASLSHTLNIPYQIVDFALAGPASLVSYPVTLNQFAIALTPGPGYQGTVQVACDATAIPGSPNCTLSPATIDFSSRTSAISVPAAFAFAPSAAPGTYPIVISAVDSGGPPVKTLTIPVTIQNFSMVAGPPQAQTLLIGGTSAPFQLTFTPYNGYQLPTQIVPWSFPAGSTFSFSPSDTITPNGSPAVVEMTVTVPVLDRTSLNADFSVLLLARATPPGSPDYDISETVSPTFTLHMQDFALVPSAPQIILVPGSTYQFQLTNQESNGLNAPVSLACPAPLPPGITCALDKPTLAAGDVATMEFAADVSAPQDLREFDIVGVASVNGSTIQHTVPLLVWISPFSFSVDPVSISIPDGGVANYIVTVQTQTLSGGSGIATVTCTSPDPGITCDTLYGFSATSGPIGFGLTARATAGVTPAGSHPINISVSQWGSTQTVTATLVTEGPDSIQVVSPNGGELWSNGTQNISWQYTGNPGATVRIDLLNKGQLSQTIAASAPIGTAGKGFYAWQIPSNLPFSQFYTIRVTSNSNSAITDTSDDRVWIGQGVDVNNPSTGDILYYSPNAQIAVNYTWSVYGNLQFDLYKSGQFVQNITTNSVSGYFESGGWTWAASGPMPANLQPGSDYSIKITPLDAPSLAVMGGLFTISNTSITLTSPKGGEIWHPGETHPITWTWVGQPVSPGVDVAITIGPMPSVDVGSGTIVPTTPIGPNGSGSYLWTIPNSVPANNAYAIGVKSFGMDNMGFNSSSGPFAIGNFHRVSVTLSGSGYVSSSDSSISCGMNCSAIYADGAAITLTATPSSGYVFMGWSGACSGSGACMLTLTADASVQANFAPPSLSISPTSSSATVRAGEAALYQMSVSGLGIGNGTVNMSCGALPEAASCTFQPNSFPMGQSPVPVNLSISTTAQQSGLLLRSTWRAPEVSPMLLLAVLLLAVCCALSHRLTGRGLARFLLPALLLALCLASACGGGGGSTGVITQPPPAPPPFTPAGTYSVTITAQSGSAVQTMKLTLVVQ